VTRAFFNHQSPPSTKSQFFNNKSFERKSWTSKSNIWQNELDEPHVVISFAHHLVQWFPNFSGARTTWNNLVAREAENIDLYRDSRTTSANLKDH